MVLKYFKRLDVEDFMLIYNIGLRPHWNTAFKSGLRT